MLASGDEDGDDRPTAALLDGGDDVDKEKKLPALMGDSESALSGQCKDGQKSERRHMINMIMMSVCFFFTFSAFTALQNLQASLNKTGKTCLAVLYGLLMVSCFITPPLVQRLSPKKTMVLCLIVHCVFTAANYYPVEYSLVPACALLGLASAPLWTAQQTYLASSAHMHAAQRPERILDEVLNRFNGIFFLIFQCTQVCGNLISSLILQEAGNGPQFNETNAFCGANSTVNDTNATGIHDSIRYTLLSVYMAFDLAGLLLCLFCLKPLSESVSQYVARGWKDTCLATLRRMIDPYLLLLIPVVIYSGMEQAYIFSEFTKHYISDCVGIGWVGYVMLVFGVVDAGSSLLCSKLAGRLGRVTLVLAGALVNGALIAFLLIWVRVPHFLVIFLFAGLWGFTDAVWNTQLNTFFGVLFSLDQEAAFANFRLWQSFGWCISFVYGDVLGMYTKLWILVSVLVVSLTLYLVAEIKCHKEKKLKV